MKIKKYLVKNIDEALRQIKKDLGKDAYILSQKKVLKKGNLNLSNVEMIEVTAAIEKSRPQNNDISSTLLNKKYNYVNPPKEDPPDLELRARMAREAVRKDSMVDIAGIKNELQPLTEEMAEIKKLLRKSTAELEGFSEFKGVFMDLFLDLVQNGVEKKLASRLINTLQYQTDADNITDGKQVKKHLFNLLTSSISLPSPLRLEKGKRKIVVMVGPTGSGKTTTIAKLSSYFKLMESRKIALLTIDSYRIGAEAHLRTYAEILDIPFYAIYNERDLKYRIDALKDFELIFIDTTGRSPNDKKGLLIMEKHLSGVPEEEKEVFLTLAAPTRSPDLFYMYEKYSIFKPDKFIFTKIDESMSLGNLFNLKMKTDIPTAYFTTGQRVPEDIEIAYPRKFARRVFLDYNKGESL
ncbi:MAG: flagellar biosynthesis protein FlhF [bacterium]|nr:flagellar biosynthesis protein FlhF [bacterium]